MVATAAVAELEVFDLFITRGGVLANTETMLAKTIIKIRIKNATSATRRGCNG